MVQDQKTLAQCFGSGNIGAVQTVRLEVGEMPPREKLQPSAGNIGSSKWPSVQDLSKASPSVAPVTLLSTSSLEGVSLLATAKNEVEMVS